METKRMKTFVTGLDEILSGGLPRGHVVLVSGHPGTMKSTFAYAMLYHNAKERAARGLYITLEQTRKSFESQMASMGFDTGHVRRRLHVLDGASIRKGLLPGPSQVWMDFMYRTMNTKKDIWGIDLLVIDSLEALEVLAQMQDRRTDLFGLLEWLRDFGATSLLVTEGATDELIVENDGKHIRRDEGFLADGIIELKMHPISDTDVQRRIRVIKMRGSHHKTGFYTLVFEDGRFQATRAMSR